MTYRENCITVVKIGLYSMIIITFFCDRINDSRKEKNPPLTICRLAQFIFPFFVDFDNRFRYIFSQIAETIGITTYFLLLGFKSDFKKDGSAVAKKDGKS